MVWLAVQWNGAEVQLGDAACSNSDDETLVTVRTMCTVRTDPCAEPRSGKYVMSYTPPLSGACECYNVDND